VRAPQNTTPKVLVGCPTWAGKSYILENYIASIKAIDYPNYDILIVDNSPDNAYAERIRSLGVECIQIPWMEHAKDRITTSRNILRERALTGGYDYFLSVEQDVIVEPKTLNAMIAHKKDFVTTLVLTTIVRDGKQYLVPIVSVDFETRPGKYRYVTSKDIAKGPLIPITLSHLACTLISRRALERFPFRHEKSGFDDSWFCFDLVKAGFALWCDTTLRPKHRPSSWSKIQK
jgi:GT2 family glycosyltransferase